MNIIQKVFAKIEIPEQFYKFNTTTMIMDNTVFVLELYPIISGNSLTAITNENYMIEEDYFL